jgi:hypothetical protein
LVLKIEGEAKGSRRKIPLPDKESYSNSRRRGRKVYSTKIMKKPPAKRAKKVREKLEGL